METYRFVKGLLIGLLLAGLFFVVRALAMPQQVPRPAASRVTASRLAVPRLTPRRCAQLLPAEPRLRAPHKDGMDLIGSAP